MIRIFKKLKPEHKTDELAFEQKLLELSKRIESSFEAITNKSLTRNAEFVQNLSVNGVDLVLRPLVNQLKDYERKVEQIAKEEAKDRTDLKSMMAYVNEINKQFSEEAQKFVIAVRGNIHAVGRWGEDTLQNILEASGFNEDKDYEKQKTYKTTAGETIRPDFVIKAPQGRALLIDSKLSLDPFMRFIEAKDDTAKKQAAKELIKSINAHVNELAKKEYQNVEGLNSFDYVLMFVSSDALLSTVLSFDKEIIRNALTKNILIVGPTSLMATLKTIEFLWREQKQMENYKEIGDAGKRIYEKLYHFLERMKDVQKSFDSANKTLGVAFNHLNRGNCCLTAEALRLKELGISSEKEIKVDIENK